MYFLPNSSPASTRSRTPPTGAHSSQSSTCELRILILGPKCLEGPSQRLSAEHSRLPASSLFRLPKSKDPIVIVSVSLSRSLLSDDLHPRHDPLILSVPFCFCSVQFDIFSSGFLRLPSSSSTLQSTSPYRNGFHRALFAAPAGRDCIAPLRRPPSLPAAVSPPEHLADSRFPRL